MRRLRPIRGSDTAAKLLLVVLGEVQSESGEVMGKLIKMPPSNLPAARRDLQCDYFARRESSVPWGDLQCNYPPRDLSNRIPASQLVICLSCGAEFATEREAIEHIRPAAALIRMGYL